MGDVVRGPWKPVPKRVDEDKVRWRRGRAPSPEQIRQHCVDCSRPFHPRGWVPVDLVCADCRVERTKAVPDEPPTLFEPDGGDAPPHV